MTALRTHRIFDYVIALPLAALAACANPGTPMGGPKDETPPVVAKSVPAQNELGYRKKEITIEFNELVQLKEINQKLVVSPPLNQQISAVERGKEVVVVFPEELQENTTYTLDFADAISDYNEGNVLDNFRFSFSTGTIIDSLAISGNLYEAGTLNPVSGAMVFIHENLADSAFHTLVPVRLAKTNDKGRFSINNVKPGQYRLYALEDANRNYKYDQPGERIAWLDSLVVPAFEYRMVTDSVGPDSTVTQQKLVYTPDSVKLFMFGEEQMAQFRTGDNRKERARIEMYFKRNARGLSVKPLGDGMPTENWAILERSAANDSLSFWLIDKEMQQKDTLRFAVSYDALDSLKRDIVKTDTIPYYYFEKVVKEKKKRKDDEKVEVPTLNFTNLRSTIDPFGTMSFVLPTAPVSFDLNAIRVNQVVDTVKVPFPVTVEQDPSYIRVFRLKGKWEAGGSYEMVIDSAAFFDVYGLTNRPLQHRFSVKGLDAYGIAYVTVANPGRNQVVQLLDSKDVAVRSAILPANGKLAFRFLQPGDYFFRIVDDKNGNGTWDVGNFEKGIQPEAVCYYPEKVSMRANWDHEVKWDPATFSVAKFSEKFRKAKKQSDKDR